MKAIYNRFCEGLNQIQKSIEVSLMHEPNIRLRWFYDPGALYTVQYKS